MSRRSDYGRGQSALETHSRSPFTRTPFPLPGWGEGVRSNEIVIAQPTSFPSSRESSHGDRGNDGRDNETSVRK